MALIFAFAILNAHAYNELRISKTDKALPLLSAKAMMVIHIILAVVFFFMFIWFCYRVWSGPGARAVRSKPIDRGADLIENEIGKATNAVGRAIIWVGERGNREIFVRNGDGRAKRLVGGLYVDNEDVDEGETDSRRVYRCSAGKCNNGDKEYFDASMEKLKGREKDKYKDYEIYDKGEGKFYLGKRKVHRVDVGGGGDRKSVV